MLPKYLASLSALIILTHAPTVFADATATPPMSPKIADFDCTGSKGTMTVEADSSAQTVKAGFVIDGKTTLVEIDQITGNKASATPDVEMFDDHYEGGGQEFESIMSSLNRPVWEGPSEGCMPTRVTGQCVHVHNPGHWTTEETAWFSLTFEPIDKQAGIYKLTSIDGKAYDLPDDALGDDVTCSGYFSF